MNNQQRIKQARNIFKSLGARVAGGYLRNRGFTLGQALAVLGFPNRFEVL